MAKKDPQVDAYIEKSAEFAKPILKHLRKLVHAAVPDVEETLKWSVPHFDYKGMMCSMASFKTHCAFGFWKGSLVLGEKAQRDAAGHLGRIESIDDLPADKTLIAYIKKAAKLNDEGVKIERVGRPKGALTVPGDFLAALKKNKKALASFESLSPSHTREYVEWITEAKADATRERRMATALEWIAEGKARSWKYM
jgi:uncharacterized protein YdeI (YjbR/CyaY-like superfamily)